MNLRDAERRHDIKIEKLRQQKALEQQFEEARIREAIYDKQRKREMERAQEQFDDYQRGVYSQEDSMRKKWEAAQSIMTQEIDYEKIQKMMEAWK